jgi:DNA-binding NarL/FixJ family response regulator
MIRNIGKQKMAHILIADDHPMFISGLETALYQYSPTLQTYQAHDIEATKAHIRRNPSIDLLLLDRTLPNIDSLQHLAELREISPSLRIAIISARESRHEIWEAMEAGAVGFIPKSLSVTAFIEAIERLLAGYPYLPRELIDNPYGQQNKNNPLSERQVEILTLAKHGMRNKEIAKRLQLTEGTIKQHFNHIYKILNAENRAHAIQIAQMRGIIC